MKNETRTSPLLEDVTAQVRRAFLGLGVFGFGINLLILATPLYTLQIFERVLTSRNVDTLVMLSLLAAIGLMTMALLEAVRGLILNRVGAWIDRQVAPDTLVAGMADTPRNGGVSGVQGLRDIATVRGFLTGPGIVPLMDAPWAPLFLLVLFLLHPAIGVLATVGALLLFGLAAGNEIATRNLQNRAGEQSRAALAQAEMMLRNAEAVDAMGMRDALIGAWRNAAEPAIDLQGRAADRTTVLTSASKFIRLGLQVSVMGIGAFLVVEGGFSAGAMIAGAILLSRALAPVEQAIGAWRGLLSARAAYGRLRRILESVAETSPAMPLPRPEGRLEAEQVSFALPGQAETILRDISFAVAPGQCLAVTGPSASGKTTLARLMVGIVRPRHGTVRLGGMDIFAWDSADRGRHVGYLPQDVELFSGTVRENIARMGQGDPEAVIEAARIAGVHDMILHLPRGYDTPIGAAGAHLSAGQRQRIGLARAVYGKPRLLVLDEPNANLDSAGEAALTDAIAVMKAEGAAVVVISHRGGVLKTADQVLVLEAGSIAAYGPSIKARAERKEPIPARKLRVVASVRGEAAEAVN